MADKEHISRTGGLFLLLAVSYAGIFLYALWTGAMENSWFWKLTVTYAVLGVLLGFIYLVRREFIDDTRMKNDKYMD